MPFDIQIVFIFAFEFYWDIVWKADLTNLFLHYVINQFYKVWDYRNKLDIDPNQKIPLFMVLPKQYFEETFPNINLLNVIYNWFFNETIDKRNWFILFTSKYLRLFWNQDEPKLPMMRLLYARIVILHIKFKVEKVEWIYLLHNWPTNQTRTSEKIGHPFIHLPWEIFHLLRFFLLCNHLFVLMLQASFALEHGIFRRVY